MKKFVTAGKNKGREYEGRYGFEDCIVTEETDNNNIKYIMIQYSDGDLSGALTKKDTIEETLHDWLWIMRDNGYEEEQIQLAVEKVKKFF